MEVAVISGNTLRLKSKNATIVVDPSSSTPKTEADVILVTQGNGESSKIDGARVTLKGTGEYEVGGVKISGLAVNDKTIFVLDLDGISTVVGSVSALTQSVSKLDEAPALIVNADTAFDPAIVSALSPSILAVYGEQKTEALKSIGKESAQALSKYAAKKDSLPVEMEVISLG